MKRIFLLIFWDEGNDTFARKGYFYGNCWHWSSILRWVKFSFKMKMIINLWVLLTNVFTHWL